MSSAQKKMGKSCLNTSSHPSTPASNEELDSLSNSELISFLESSFRHSEFINVARVLQSREELAKAEALKNISKASNLEAKNRSLEEELHGLRSNEAVGKLERELVKEKSRYFLSRVSYENMEKLAQEKIKVFMENIREEKTNCLRLKEQLDLEKARNARLAEVDSWKTKYSLLEAWILRFFENNHGLIEKFGEQDVNGKKLDVEFFRISKAAGELLTSNAVSNRKESFLAARTKSKQVIDVSNSDDIQLIGESKDKSSELKYPTNSCGKNCNKRKFQIAQTSGVRRVLELDDDDGVVCINDLKAEGLK